MRQKKGLTVHLGWLWLFFLFLVGQVWSVANSFAGTGLYLPLLRTAPAEHPSQIDFVPFATGFNTVTITGITHAHDDRLFVLEREGRIRVVETDGSILSQPFLDITLQVSTDNWEEGLLGLVFHPDYPQTPYFYLHYTATGTHAIQIDRYTVSQNPNLADPNSRLPLITIAKPADEFGISPVHNGGAMAFAPDGYLYIAVGDGGPDPIMGNGIPGDPNNHSQRLDVLLGKLLRIDVNNSGNNPNLCGGTSNYAIPADNPFVEESACPEIWALGLRNPWRFSWDRLTGDLYVADVGEWQREEINVVPALSPAGINFGWHCWEGDQDYRLLYPELAAQCSQDANDYHFPAYTYPHHNGACSITGGYLYRGGQEASLYGDYLYTDFCNGQVGLLYADDAGIWQNLNMGTTTCHISTFGEGVDGELYAGIWTNSTPDCSQALIYKIVASDNP